ncbi:MAG: hypothetical protein AAF773_12615 [Cyanobacteria bacterium P01_D01_bin.115]
MKTSYLAATEQDMHGYYTSLSEKERRCYAVVEAVKLGQGGISYISYLLGCYLLGCYLLGCYLLGCDHHAIQSGACELADECALYQPRIRRRSGGRKAA